MLTQSEERSLYDMVAAPVNAWGGEKNMRQSMNFLSKLAKRSTLQRVVSDAFNLPFLPLSGGRGRRCWTKYLFQSC
jgi:hypothetical protein